MEQKHPNSSFLNVATRRIEKLFGEEKYGTTDFMKKTVICSYLYHSEDGDAIFDTILKACEENGDEQLLSVLKKNIKNCYVLNKKNLDYLKERKKLVETCMQSSSTPSSYGDEWEEKTPILSGRRLHGKPVELFCKEFQDFVSNLKKVQVEKEDLEFARQMQKEMSKKFGLESERAELFRDLFGIYTNEKLVIASFPTGKKGRPPNTDGSIMVTIKNEEMCVLNLEVKNELGKGTADGYVEGTAYYTQFIGPLSMNEHGIFNRSNLPCLLVTLIGAHIGVSGAITSTTPTIQWLTDLISLSTHNYDNDGILSIARLFKSIKIAVRDLKKYYHNIDSTSYQPGYPFVTSCGDFSWTYSKPLFTFENQRPIYLAELKEGEKVIVKFSKEYAVAPHQYLAEKGMAPKLYGTLRLEGGWVVNVMEFLNQDEWIPMDYYFYIAKKQKHEIDAVCNNLEEVVHTFHEVGYVHGDLRPNNIFVNTKTFKCTILDWDWSGKEGVVCYLAINLGVDWPEGVAPGEKVTKKHDLEWVKRIKDKLKA